LVRHPHAGRQLAGLPEHVDRHAAARIPIAAYAQPFRPQPGNELLADRDRAILVEGAMIAEAGEIELQGFRLNQPLGRYVVDDQMGKIRLSGDRA
jgi:hypothetical protein